MKDAFQKITELSWIGTTVTIVFVLIFLVILIWVIKGNKRLYKKHAKMPFDNDNNEEIDKESPDKN
jgi:Na+-transporting methylmalonyl-CoA/oxaloacetate decarboxylase gamma subunit